MFERKYPNLTSPIRIGDKVFRNRMFSAPMGGTDITDDCSVGFRTQGFYELRAKGGAAAVTASELVVHPETDASHMFHIDLAVPGNLAGWTFLADAVARHGAVASVELSHSGQYAGTYLLDKNTKQGLTQYGPMDSIRPDGIPVKALTVAQLDEIVAAYANAATLAKRAGFGMVMVHGGHGWLLHQFTSPYTNQRTDQYGGSFENRIRLTLRVLQAVRDAVGSGFPIEFRMSGSELFDGGYTIETGIEIAKAVEPLVDLIHVSAGSYQFGFFDTHPSMFSDHGCNVHLAAQIKPHVSKPVATIGALNDPAYMEEIIASGKADVVYMARALLADPYLPSKVMENRDDEIVHCLRCFACMAERPTTQSRRCTVNPLIGREWQGVDVIPAPVKKKVVVAGGGVGGLYAALTAAKRGHHVTLCEQSHQLGGILNCEQAVSFKYDMFALGRTLETLARKENVDIRLNTKVTPELLDTLQPDALVLAVGSTPIVPPITGIQGNNVIVVNDYYLHTEEVGQKVVVLGGGLAGCECAIHLGQEGKDVTVVEMRNTLAPDANIRNRPILLKQIEQYTKTLTCHKALSITEEGVTCLDLENNAHFLQADTVICATGQRANRGDVDILRNGAPFVREIGDCVHPATILQAIYQGYHAALDI